MRSDPKNFLESLLDTEVQENESGNYFADLGPSFMLMTPKVEKIHSAGLEICAVRREPVWDHGKTRVWFREQEEASE